MILACIGMLVLLAVIGLRVHFDRRVGCTLIGTVLLVLAAPQGLGAGSFLDYRLAVVPALLALSLCRIRMSPGAGGNLFILALCATVFVRSVSLFASWNADGQFYREFALAAERLPPRSILLTGFERAGKDISWRQYWHPPMDNISTLAVGHGLFVPMVFAHPAQQPLALRAEFRQWNMAVDVGTGAELLSVSRRAAELCPTARAQSPKASVFLFIRHPKGEAVENLRAKRDGSYFRFLNICD